MTAGASSEQEFDVIIVGAGPAGEVAAGRLAAPDGKRVAVVEAHLIGGECSFYACMPSKALLRPTEALHEARRVPGAAEAISGQLDVQAVLSRRDEAIRHLDDSAQLPWLEDRGIELFRGWGCLDGERRVRVGGQVLIARDAVVLSVGTAAAFPPIPGLREVGAWSNRELTTSEEVPDRLLVLGGGIVGAELAQAWAWLGASVTVVEALDRLISHEDPFASELVAAGLREAGVELVLGVGAARACRDGREVSLELEDGRTFTADRLLVATGRKPLTEQLGLESVGVEGGGYVEVDEQMRVGGRPWLYAVGDVNGRSLLTHSGKYQARIAADCILGRRSSAWADVRGAPRVIFTEPQVAGVGLTLAAAREHGIDALAIDIDTSGSAGGSFYGRGSGGTTRFVVDPQREILVGVTFVGAEIQDFLQAATIAVAGEVPLRRLAHAIAPFPTRSELWLKFIEAYEKERGVSLHVS
jgi:pyruvate/2-oxoglutarate dehydrogenase complex dihydrolipoamide dehydrogenase (E3) component